MWSSRLLHEERMFFVLCSAAGLSMGKGEQRHYQSQHARYKTRMAGLAHAYDQRSREVPSSGDASHKVVT